MLTNRTSVTNTTASDETKTALYVPNTHGVTELEELKQQRQKLQDIIQSFRDLTSKIQKNSPLPSLEELIAQPANVIKPTHSFWPKDINIRIEENLHAMLDSLAAEYKKLILLSDKLNNHQNQMKLCDDTINLASDLEKFIDKTIQLINEEKEAVENKQHTTQNLPLAILKFLITSAVPPHFNKIFQVILDIWPQHNDGNKLDDVDLQIQEKIQNELSNENNMLNKIIATLDVLYYKAEKAFKMSAAKQTTSAEISTELTKEIDSTSMQSLASQNRLFSHAKNNSSLSSNINLSHSEQSPTSSAWRCQIL